MVIIFLYWSKFDKVLDLSGVDVIFSAMLTIFSGCKNGDLRGYLRCLSKWISKCGFNWYFCGKYEICWENQGKMM